MMELLILRKGEQAEGAFDGGRIQERKPIGFPQDRGKLRPYGNLFYWAHAWANADSLIGEHPHKGFEIMSFVLKGDIEHYDSQLKGWKPLHEGDVQIIRAGSGITHAERMASGAEIFQIWFDPGLDRTLTKQASYNDYPASAFKWTPSSFGESMEYVGAAGLISMDAQPLRVERHRYTDGVHNLPLASGDVVSCFVISGGVTVDGNELVKGDFFRIQDTSSYTVATEGAELFVIITPKVLDYRSYYELMQSRAH